MPAYNTRWGSELNLVLQKRVEAALNVNTVCEDTFGRNEAKTSEQSWRHHLATIRWSHVTSTLDLYSINTWLAS